MKTQLLSLCIFLSVLAMTGCSDDDAPINPAEGDAIRFSAVISNRSRSTPTTTATIKQFTVYAFTQTNMLMDSVTVNRDGGSWTYSPEIYWPTSPVNFYALSPAIKAKPDIPDADGGHIPGYLCDGTTDLLYATRINVMQQAAPVELNFRHALANVSVFLSSNNPRIQVKVHHIVLNNIYLQGTFDFPQQSTLASAPQVIGKWSMLRNLNKMLLFYAIATDEIVTLTPEPTNYSTGNLNTGFVIPQTLTGVSLDNGIYTGSYIAVECEIFDTATGAKLWPNSSTPDYMLVPETDCGRIVYSTTSAEVNEWLPGHAYNYNISINNPDVLDKIEFEVNVDDFNINEI